MSRRRVALAVAFAFVLLFGSGALWCVRLRTGPPRAAGFVDAPPAAPSAQHRDRRGQLDLTFLVFSDTHFGFDARELSDGSPRDPLADPDPIDRINQRAIAAMNGIGGKPWPAALGGTIALPRALVVTGDLTEDGDPRQWRHFTAHFGLNGHDGLLAYPVYENFGNHDKHHSWYVLERVKERHGSTRYVLDWGDLHLVSLGEAPDETDLGWLARDLTAVGRERPVILAFHFPLRGPFSRGNWFGDGSLRDQLATVLGGYNVIAILHGHYHHAGRYSWHGFDVYKAGSAKHDAHAFLVVRVTDTRLRVAAWQFTLQRWDFWHEKPINAAPGEPRYGGARDDYGLYLGPGGP